jgi:hypothetical protein
VVTLLVLSAGALTAAPFFMPTGYAWIIHTTSESAAQGLEGAWVARLGFLAFGMAVVGLAGASRATWGRGVVVFHLLFGVGLIATATFSHRPWLPEVPFDPIEDLLHSFAATAMGFAFAIGVALRLVQRVVEGGRGRVLDVAALVAATAIPAIMAFEPDVAGLVQRLMFLVAYAWYGSAAWGLADRG